MNSLRFRLVIGSALVAVVPLALVMVVLSQRIERMVREQAAERLDATLGALQAQVGADATRAEEQIRILARDAQLRRLSLVRQTGSRDLHDYLEERRRLLGLDVLAITGHGVTVDSASVETQDGQAIGGRGAVMQATAPIQYQGEDVGTLTGGTWLDGRILARLKRGSGVDLALRDPGGRVSATTLPAPPAGPASASTGGMARVSVAGRSYLSRSLSLGAAGTTITGFVPTTDSDRTIAALQAAAVLLGVMGLAVAILLALLWSSQVSRPVERLAAFSDQVARGEWEQPLELRSVRELETLVTSLERMRLDLKASRDRLIVSERQAAWGQMAQRVAHEVKNPLTPIAVSVSDLKRSYDAKREDFPQILDQAVRTIADEVATLKRLLQEFSDFARFPAPRPAPVRLSDLLADLGTLYGRDIAEQRLAVTPPARDVTLQADAGQLRQALVNLIKNGLEASEGHGAVTLAAAIDGASLTLTVSDTGPGLTPDQRANLFVPGYTTKALGSGLGLTIVERIVSDHGGTITADSVGARGTTFHVRLPLDPPLAPES